MEKRYGLPTAICMVVGIVIGSGVFFKAEKVLQATKGNMPLGILAWGIVGAIMIICSYVFATMATRYEKVSGLVDYAEATVGRRYAYYVGWFMAVLYTPCLVSAPGLDLRPVLLCTAGLGHHRRRLHDHRRGRCCAWTTCSTPWHPGRQAGSRCPPLLSR